MMDDPVYNQISYNRSLVNAFRLKLGHNLMEHFGEMKAAPAKNMVEHVIRLAKVIPASLDMVRYAHCKSVYWDFGGIW